MEVQEIRDDNMDMELFIEPFGIDNANKACEICKWCYVTEID